MTNISQLNSNLSNTKVEYSTYKHDNIIQTRLLESQKIERDNTINTVNNKLFEIDRLYSNNRIDLETKIVDMNKSLDEKQ